MGDIDTVKDQSSDSIICSDHFRLNPNDVHIYLHIYDVITTISRVIHMTILHHNFGCTDFRQGQLYFKLHMSIDITRLCMTLHHIRDFWINFSSRLPKLVVKLHPLSHRLIKFLIFALPFHVFLHPVVMVIYIFSVFIRI